MRTDERDDGFSDGILYALAVLTTMGDAGSTAYCEIIQGAGKEKIIARARKERAVLWAGIDKYRKLHHE